MEETAALESSLLELPEDINLHILSYHVDQLKNRDALRLSLLSKQLQHVGNNKQLCYPAVEEGVYNRCIELVAKKGLRNFNLWMRNDDNNVAKPYVLPQSIFQVESLVELTLENCCLKPDRIVAWPNLKRLSIGPLVRGTHEIFGSIIKGCPSIEFLKFNSHLFNAESKFKVANIRNLKQLYFGLGHHKHRLEVNAASNLESIQIMHDIGRYPIMPYNVIDFGRTESYPRLRSIEVTSKGLDEKFFVNFAPRFPKLEKLCVRKCTTLKKISLSSASLKEMKLIDNTALQEAYFDLPELVHFEYTNTKLQGSDKLIPKLTSFGKNSGRWSFCIKLTDSETNMKSSWFMGLHEFLASLNGSETSVSVKILRGHRGAYPVIADPVIPVPGIREFSLDTTELEISKPFTSAILDCISLTFQPQTITFLECKNRDWFTKIKHSQIGL